MRQIPRLAAMAWQVKRPGEAIRLQPSRWAPAVADGSPCSLRTQLKAGLLREFWALVLSLAAFAVFLAWNGGVVLGDKSNHVSVFHPTQLLYLCLYVSLVLAPVHWVPSRYRRVLVFLASGPLPRAPVRVGCVCRAAAMAAKAAQALRSRPSGALLIAGLAAGLMLCSVHFFTLVHPFTLADNRHYMFYIWRRVFAR